MMPRGELRPGDMRDVLFDMAGRNELLDACVTDPPYHLTSVVKRFGKPGSAPAKHGRDGLYARQSGGFMGKQWDGGDIAFQPETWRAVWEVLKPGAYLLAFGGTRTEHRIACAIEDAGFEIRDKMLWLYGTGFPKSHDVSKGIDAMLGAERAKVRHAARSLDAGSVGGRSDPRPWVEAAQESGFHEVAGDEPVTPEAAAWHGWGTALKPAFEPIVVARKPLVGTVASNVLQFGTGALNIDGCRIAHDEPIRHIKAQAGGDRVFGQSGRHMDTTDLKANGRWPANVVHDGSDEVEAAFAAFGERGAAARVPGVFHGDFGSASRFFYSAKATAADRAGSKHPTVKPVALMRYLCRLVTRPGGTVLDPFAGSGSTMAAAIAEGFNSVGIEREAEYQADILRRLETIELDRMCA